MEFLALERLCTEKTQPMKEDFLQYLWRIQHFNHRRLQTTTGQRIEVIQPGLHNTHAGPDFLDARLRIGGTLWAGNVEIHLQASDWRAHQHQHDPAYANVVLHVVLVEDEVIYHPDGERLATLELQRRIPKRLAQRYQKLLQQQTWIPCQAQFTQVPELTRWMWLDRLLVERLEAKTARIRERLLHTQNDWESSFYQLLARAYGLQVNADPFEQLARSLPLNLIGKHKDQLRQIEALLFGQAGLLEKDFKDDYPQKLQREYRHLRAKYQLRPLPPASWKFLRLRPANFPTLRIAQFAMLLHQATHLFSKVLVARRVVEIENLFDRRISAYWQTHYRFDRPSQKRTKKLGKKTIHLLLINTIAPFIFHYGHTQDEARYKDQALQLLEELPAEHNHIIQHWKQLDMQPKSAYQSQALLQLKKQYCQRKRCLQCGIGHAIFSKG